MRQMDRSAPRIINNSFKHQIHAQEAAAKFKAAYNNAGPAVVSIVENAAAYFEGKDTPEAIVDKERSYERYQFNIDMLTEIFDGPLPAVHEEKDAGQAPTAPENGDGNVDKAAEPSLALNSSIKDGPEDPDASVQERLMQKIGKRMLTRTHEERMAEMEQLKQKYSKVEKQNRETEKVSMRLFQKLERATTAEELEKIRGEYERENRVKFVEAPPPIVKRELDRSLPRLQPSPCTRILQFPQL